MVDYASCNRTRGIATFPASIIPATKLCCWTTKQCTLSSRNRARRLSCLNYATFLRVYLKGIVLSKTIVSMLFNCCRFRFQRNKVRSPLGCMHSYYSIDKQDDRRPLVLAGFL